MSRRHCGRDEQGKQDAVGERVHYLSVAITGLGLGGACCKGCRVVSSRVQRGWRSHSDDPGGKYQPSSWDVRILCFYGYPKTRDNGPGGPSYIPAPAIRSEKCAILSFGLDATRRTGPS